MGKFTASLRLPGDSNSLAAVVRVGEGRIRVLSGDHLIGDWEIRKVDLSRVPEGFQLSAEGEVLLLDIADRASFEEETNASTAKGHKTPLQKTPKASRPPRVKGAKQAKQPSAPSKPAGGTVVAASTTSTESPAVDRFLAAAESRFGSVLPPWAFTRGGLVVLVAVLVITVVFTGFVSTILLISGLIGLLIGGLSMLDAVIARQVLRSKITPIRVVILSGTVFVAGVLLGFLA